MEKVSLSTNGTQLQFRLPITKVDKQRRIVSGFATLDNVDREGDLVTTAASEKAFGRWRGNIREMHAPVAVGKAVSFETKEYTDEATGDTYQGIYVDAYVSTGAEATWQKVLDGTLSGFSIGGGVLKYETKKDASSGADIRVITDYELTELSLVDSPANQLANIVSIHKFEGSTVGTGLVYETELLNVFSNGEDLWLTSEEAPLDKSFEYIGWVEDNEQKISQIRKLLESSGTIGGFNMSDTVEKAADVNEVESVEETAEQSNDFEGLFTKFSGEIKELVETSIAKSEELSGQVAKATEAVEGFGTKVEDVEKKFTELSEQVTELAKRIETVEETGGDKKSEEVEKSDSVVETETNPYISKVFKGTLVPLGAVVQQ